MKALVILFLLFILSNHAHAQIGEMGLSLNGGISTINSFGNSEQSQSYFPSGNFGFYLEKNNKTLGFGTELSLIQIEGYRSYNSVFILFGPGLTIVSTTPVYTTERVHSSQLGIHVYSTIRIKKIGFDLGFMPHAEIFRSKNFTTNSTDPFMFLSMEGSTNTWLTKKIYLASRLSLMYDISDHFKIRLNAICSNQKAYQFSLGVSYIIVQLGVNEF